MKRKFTVFDAINIFCLLCVTACLLIPIIHIVALSFSDMNSVVLNKVGLLPAGFNLQAYELILTQRGNIVTGYINALIYVSAATSLNILMTSVAAYPLSRRNMFGRKYFLFMIIITMFFTGGIIPNYMLLRSLNLLDTIWAVILPDAIWVVQLLILKSFYESIDPGLHEAAFMDGASEYRILFTIYIPLSKAAISSVGLFFLMGNWNEYFKPMIYFTTPKKFPLQVVLTSLMFSGGAVDTYSSRDLIVNPASSRSAAITLSLIPMLIAYLFAQKYFEKGIMLGSIKG